jgi:hypothetical protein
MNIPVLLILAQSRAASEPDFADVPVRILALLRAEGVTSFADWRALGRKRLSIFGIVPSVVRQLDALARGAP